MDQIISNFIGLISKPEAVLAVDEIVLVIAGVFSSVSIRENSIHLSNKRSILSFFTGFALIFGAMLNYWWPLFNENFNCKQLTDIRNIIINSKDMSYIASQNCSGDFQCDKHTALSYNRSNDAINYINQLINDRPSLKSSCPK